MSEHKPIPEQTRGVMNALAEAIDEALNGKARPKKVGFALLVFPFGDPGQDRINYIGNGERREVLVALKELAARWEGRVVENKTTQ